jgi:hypothetical protein
MVGLVVWLPQLKQRGVLLFGYVPQVANKKHDEDKHKKYKT